MNNVNCQHFVQRKKRYCRMTVRPGEIYCGEHQPVASGGFNLESSDLKTRVVCPLDKSHTCYEKKLEQHLKKCNANNKNSVSYFKKNFNRVICNNDDERRPLFKHSTNYVLETISKVKTIYDVQVNGSIIRNTEISHDLLKSEINNTKYGNNTLKHLIQTSALIGILYEYGLIKANTCFVEFGAGKGKLSYWLARSIENNLSNSSILLIERSSLRHKMDNKLKKNKEFVERIRVDIADLVLKNVEMIKMKDNIVAITKHLCGEATDLALRCLMAVEKEKNISGALMSFCCHHKCRWENYVGRKFFKDVGLTKNDFDIMCRLASWSVCGTGQSRERRSEDNTKTTASAEYYGERRINPLNLCLSEREEVGVKCKRIIDWGRKMYFEEYSLKSDLVCYVKPSVTLENVCIVAVRK